jgi:hypothetical protein
VGSGALMSPFLFRSSKSGEMRFPAFPCRGEMCGVIGSRRQRQVKNARVCWPAYGLGGSGMLDRARILVLMRVVFISWLAPMAASIKLAEFHRSCPGFRARYSLVR